MKLRPYLTAFVVVLALSGSAVVQGCGGAGSPFEEAQKHSKETQEKVDRATTHFEQTSKEVNDAYRREQRADERVTAARAKTCRLTGRYCE